MKKSNIALLIVFFLLIPATILLGSLIKGRGYYITSTLIIIEILIPFIMGFEGRKPQARELVVIAVMCVIAVISRAAVPLPSFKPMYAVIMLAGMAFGAETGFLIGAVTAFTSNFFFGQGAYTPWQMMAYGACGMIAGFCFAKGRIKRKPLIMAVFGFAAVFLFIGPLLDTCSLFLMMSHVDWNNVWPMYAAGIPVNASQGLCTALTMLLLGKPLLEKLDRVKLKSGIED